MEKEPGIGDPRGKVRGKLLAGWPGTCLDTPTGSRQMATNDDVGGGGEREEGGESSRVEGISPQWLRSTQQTNRVEFEREMERHRQRFDSEFQRFWRAHQSPT